MNNMKPALHKKKGERSRSGILSSSSPQKKGREGGGVAAQGLDLSPASLREKGKKKARWERRRNKTRPDSQSGRGGKGRGRTAFPFCGAVRGGGKKRGWRNWDGSQGVSAPGLPARWERGKENQVDASRRGGTHGLPEHLAFLPTKGGKDGLDPERTPSSPAVGQNKERQGHGFALRVGKRGGDDRPVLSRVRRWACLVLPFRGKGEDGA